MKYNEKDTSRIIWLILLGFSLAFIAAAFAAGNLKELIPGLIRINTRPSQFTMDYLKLGGVGAAFLNTGLIGLICCGLLYFSKAQCDGLTVAAYWLNTGFGTWGMTLLTPWPFFLGAWLYSRIKKIPFGKAVNQALFATALAPFAGEMLFRYPGLQARPVTAAAILGALVLGVLVGMAMPPLCAHAPAFHKGYDLYSAGPAAGFLAFLIYCVLYRSPGLEVPTNTDLGEGERLFVTVFFALLFAALLVLARCLDENCFHDYRKLWKSTGYQTDFAAAYGLPAAIVNMGVYGLFILLYYNAVQGLSLVDGAPVLTGAKFTGATMGAIMCMYAFCMRGAHPRNVFWIMIGYAVASLLPFAAAALGLVETQNWTLTTQAMLVGLCFASGLAPVTGVFGPMAGIAAGIIHAMLVMSVPLLHGGFCLYNGGFTAGITAFILVPVLECYGKKRQA